MAEPQHQGENGGPVGGLVPRPDPSVLTTQQLTRELAWLREVMEGRLATGELDRAWLKSEIERLPALIVAENVHTRELHAQKFLTVDTQFKERDVRIDQTARDGGAAIQQASLAAKEAVAAALQAAKEAVGKSELVTAEAIKQLSTLMDTNNRALGDKIDTLTARVALIEGRGSGYSASGAIVMAVVGTLIGVVGLAVALLR